VQAAVDRARPGDRIVLARGTYPGGVLVPPAKHDITIVGEDRNGVVFDGGDTRENAIVVQADGVSILNMSAHNFTDNGFFWGDADRFRASYLTVWNVLGYGLYIEGGRGGTVDNDYVSGAADAAYYVGECKPCDATIANVVATRSAVGYSGTNASGVTIRDSTWSGNGAGIVPNTYANEGRPPQQRATITGNTITDSGRFRVPVHTLLAGFVGTGIAVAGGNFNTITNNRVLRSERYGIAVFSTARLITLDPNRPEPTPRWRAHGNRVAGNEVSGSGRADLVIAAGAGSNSFSSAQRGAADLEARVYQMVARMQNRRKPPPYTAMPAPPPQPNMPS